MSEGRKIIDEKSLEKVVGGFFLFSGSAQTITYTHKDGSTTVHQVLNMDKAWETSNNMHAQKIPEDDIMRELQNQGYVAK